MRKDVKLNIVDDDDYSQLCPTVDQSDECLGLASFLLKLGVDIRVGKEEISKLLDEGLFAFYNNVSGFLDEMHENFDDEKLETRTSRILELSQSEKYKVSPHLNEKAKSLRCIYCLGDD